MLNFNCHPFMFWEIAKHKRLPCPHIFQADNGLHRLPQSHETHCPSLFMTLLCICLYKPQVSSLFETIFINEWCL